MDEIVLRAMAKWPNVPAVYGWLNLNLRGQWLIKHEPVVHPALIAYIARNYASDTIGRWYFQNGPQRVFVELALAPLVLRIPGPGRLETHTGLEVRLIQGAWLDTNGALFLRTEHGPAVIDDRDAETLTATLTDSRGLGLDEDASIESLEKLQQGERTGLTLEYLGQRVELFPIAAQDVPRRLGFVRVPRPEENQEPAA